LDATDDVIRQLEQLRTEVERLRAAVTEIGAAHIAANVESERLRTKLDLLREMLRPGLEDAPNGPVTLVRAARKILREDRGDG
jgi:regulator of replication initiation timing